MLYRSEFRLEAFLQLSCSAVLWWWGVTPSSCFSRKLAGFQLGPAHGRHWLEAVGQAGEAKAFVPQTAAPTVADACVGPAGQVGPPSFHLFLPSGPGPRIQDLHLLLVPSAWVLLASCCCCHQVVWLFTTPWTVACQASYSNLWAALQRVPVGDFPDGLMVKTLPSKSQGVQVWSLVRELRSHISRGQSHKEIQRARVGFAPLPSLV